MIADYLSLVILFFIVYFFGLSADLIFKFTHIIKKELYKELAKISVGFTIYTFFIFLVSLFRIPLLPYIFIILSLITPLVYTIKQQDSPFGNIKERLKNFKKEISIAQIIVILAIITAFVLLLTGTFKYPYLEDGDPWSYALGAKYIATFKNYHTPAETLNYNMYLFPQSNPTLTAHLGILLQITPNILWLMKVFINIALLMGFIAFFIFVYVLSENEIEAMFATLILLIVPSYVGHFLFSYTLAVSLIPAFLFSLAFLIKTKKIVFAAICFATVAMAHSIVAVETAVIVLCVMLYFFFKEIIHEKIHIKKSILLKIILMCFLAFLLSFVYYGDFIASVNLKQWYTERAGSFITFSKGSATYDLEPNPISDFFIAQNVSRMDQEKGIGLVLFSLCLIAVIFILISRKFYYKKQSIYLYFFLFFFLFLWVFTGGIFKFSIQNYRWWSVLAISVALLAGWFLAAIWNALKKQAALKYILFALLAFGLIFTSAIPRYSVQRSYWSPDPSFTSNEEVNGYLWLNKNIAFNTPIYDLCYNNYRTVAMGMQGYEWNQEISAFRINSTGKTAEEIYSFLSPRNFKYVVLSATCAREQGINETNNLLRNMVADTRFKPIYNNQAFFVFSLT